MGRFRWCALVLALVASGGWAGTSSTSFRVSLQLVAACQVERREDHADGRGKAAVHCGYKTPHAQLVSEMKDPDQPGNPNAKLRVVTLVF